MATPTIPEYKTSLTDRAIAGLADYAYYHDPLNELTPPQGATTAPPYATPIKSLAEVQADAGTSALNNATAPSWMANAQGIGTLGLGIASFLDNRKTASLQRDALKQNLALSKEHQANQKALSASWSKGWSQ